MIDAYFGEFERGADIVREQIIEPEQKMEVVDTVYDNVQLPALVMAYHIPAIGTDDYYAMNMLNLILSNGQSSRMNKRLVTRASWQSLPEPLTLPVKIPGFRLLLR